MDKMKPVLALVLIAAVLIIVFQNTEAVSTKILFMTVTMPRAALIAVTLLVGILVGILFTLGHSRSKREKD